MLKITLNRLKPQAEITAEEQAGFRTGKSTIEQIFNLQILCEKHLQPQQDLHHVFINIKKTFDMVWYELLRVTMKKYNISANLIRVIKHLCGKDISAFLFNGSREDLFRTTIGVRQRCLFSPIIFNIFLKKDHDRRLRRS